MAETQITGRQIKDKSVFDLDIDLSTAPAHPSLVASDRIVIVDPTDGNIKTSTLTNLYTVLDSMYLLLSGGTISGNLVVSGTTTLNAVTKQGTAMITNLNADLLDGYHASGFSLTSHTHNLTDGIFDGNGLLYRPYPSQPAIGSTPATGIFYSNAVDPNSVGQVNYSGTMRAHVFNAAVVFGGNYGAYLGSAGMTQYDEEYGVYHGSGDQIIALMGYDQGIDTYVYAGGQLVYNSSYFYLGGYVMSPRFHSTIATGYMPIQVASTTLCSNLNADLLDGNHASAFALSAHTHAYEPVIIAGTSSQYWRGDKTWQPMPAFGTGTVTSVGLTLPSIFTVSGSPVLTSGTISAALVSQTKNHVLIAPQFADGVPSFRKLTPDDIPDLSNQYDNYYSWNIQIGSGSVYQMLKTGSTTYTSSYNSLRFLSGAGISITESSIAGGALGVSITCDIVSNTSSVVTYASSVAVATGGAFTAISSLTLPVQGTYLVLSQIMCSFTSPLNNVQAKIFNGSNIYGSTHLGSPLNDTTYKTTTFWAIVQASTNNYVVYLSATASVSGATVISNSGLAANGTTMSYIRLI